MKKINGLLFILSLLLLASCGSGKVLIQTTPPGATVYFKEAGGTVERSLGETPLELKGDKLKDMVKNPVNPSFLKLKKYGYSDEKIVISNFSNSDTTYSFELTENVKSDVITKIDETSSELFEIQRKLRNGDIQGPIKQLESLLKKYKQSSFINELMGSAYYLSKDFKKSLFFYNEAYKYNTENVDAYKMKKYLEEKLGVERPLAKN